MSKNAYDGDEKNIGSDIENIFPLIFIAGIYSGMI